MLAAMGYEQQERGTVRDMKQSVACVTLNWSTVRINATVCAIITKVSLNRNEGGQDTKTVH